MKRICEETFVNGNWGECVTGLRVENGNFYWLCDIEEWPESPEFNKEGYRIFAPYKGEIENRNFGSLISFETGEAITYGLFNAQGRGRLLVRPGDKVYEGMVVGANPKGDDIVVNVCKRKQLTNMRTSASDEALKLTPIQDMSLEAALEFIDNDEYVEVTPQNIRIRKAILDHQLRAKSRKPVVAE